MSVTENQSGPKYVTLSLCVWKLDHLQNISRASINSNDPVISPIEEKMFHKLEQYDGYIRSNVVIISRILDPRFGNDVLRDSDTLCLHVNLERQYDIGGGAESQSEIVMKMIYGIYSTFCWMKIALGMCKKMR